MKNILLVVPRLNIGGAETYVATVALKLQDEGFRVFVASGGGMLAKKLEKAGIQQFFLPIRLSVAISAYFLARIVKKYNIDLIHANSAAAGIAAVMMKKKYRSVPVVYTAHGVFGHNKQEMRLDECDKIICVSEFVRQDAIKKGFNQDKIITLYNGIDLNQFKPAPDQKAAIRSKYNIPQEAFTIAIISRIKNLYDKGHADILQVLEQYPGAEDWHLMVIGKGKGLHRLHQELKAHQLEDRVHCLGHIVDVQNILAGADAVVLPSKFETFGLVLAEAMAMEKPAVTYAVGGTPEVIENGRTGFLVESQNIEDLYHKIALLAADRDRCMAMGKASRIRVQENFSIERMMEKVIAIYHSMLIR